MYIKRYFCIITRLILDITLYQSVLTEQAVIMDREQIKNILCQIVRQEPEIAFDSSRCRGLLLDRLKGWSSVDISYLISAIEKGIVGQMSNPTSLIEGDRLKEDLILLLQSRSDLKLIDAVWVVRTWWEALQPLKKKGSTIVEQITKDKPDKILVTQELLDFIAHIETEPSCVELVTAAKRGDNRLNHSLTWRSQIGNTIKSLFLAQSPDFHGRTYVSCEYKKDAEITARIVTWSNLLDFITNYPIIFFLFNDMGLFPALIISSCVNLGLLKLTNDTAAAVSRQRTNLNIWSKGSLFILVGINSLQSLVSGVGIELIKNQSQLQQNLAREVIEHKVASIGQLKNQGSLEYQTIRDRCDRQQEKLETLPKEHHLRDSLYVELKGTYAEQKRGWQGIALDKLPLCVRAERMRKEADSYYDRAYTELQVKLNNRYQTSNDLVFLQNNFPELYQQHFLTTGEIISGVDTVRLAWESFFGKLAKQEFSALGLSFYLFIISCLTSLGAIIVILGFNCSHYTKVSLSEDIASDIDAWFDEIEKVGNASAENNN